MAKISLTIVNKDGSESEVQATKVSDEWAYHKDIDSGLYAITYVPSGKKLGMLRTVASVKELLNDERFFNDKESNGTAPPSWLDALKEHWSKDVQKKKR